MLSHTRNTRSILPDSCRFIRSDVPVLLTQADIQWLKENQITTIIDLREAQERSRKPCPLEKEAGFQYFCMPVSGGSEIPPSVDAVPCSYIRMVDGQMARIIEKIQSAGTNVLYFCNAGKDRTGVVSAILLSELHMDREYILRDYLKSRENLRDVLLAYALENPQVDLQVITPQQRYMEVFLDWLQSVKAE